jgi:hypothetical protein
MVGAVRFELTEPNTQAACLSATNPSWKRQTSQASSQDELDGLVKAWPHLTADLRRCIATLAGICLESDWV